MATVEVKGLNDPLKFTLLTLSSSAVERRVSYTHYSHKKL